jgi:hypothetical protein
MPNDDEQLATVMRAIDPARTPELDTLTPAQIAIRDRITATRSIRPAHRRPTLWLATALPAAAILVMALVVVFTFAPVRPAAALSPRPLAFTSTGQTSQEVLDMARAALQAKPTGPAQAARGSESLGWYAHIDDPGTRGQRVAISPEITTYRWDADQSGRVTIVAAEPYWADGGSDGVPAEAAPAAGTVISDVTFTAESFALPTAAPPPTSSPDMLAWLTQMTLVDDPDAADLMDGVGAAFSLWTMTDEQHAVILDLLLSRNDVTVLGSTTDRAGREVVGVAADSSRYPGVRRLMLISKETGRIVGVESFRTTAGGDLPADFVIDYTLWDWK